MFGFPTFFLDAEQRNTRMMSLINGHDKDRRAVREDPPPEPGLAADASKLRGCPQISAVPNDLPDV